MSCKTQVVLVGCGSYNPITNMHLRMFEIARDSLEQTGKYEVIEGIISPVSDSYPKKGLLASNHRCVMVQLAAQSSGWIRLDSWESEQNQWTATLTVLQHFQALLQRESSASAQGSDNCDSVAVKKRKIDANNKNYIVADAAQPNNASGPPLVKFLCGADVLESFAIPGIWRPEHMEEIVRKFGVVVCTRSGSDIDRFIYESDLLTKYKHNIDVVREWMPNEISSTRIRTAVRRGESIRYLVPDVVIDYIAQHKLYSTVIDSDIV